MADQLYDSASLIRPGLYEVYSKQARMPVSIAALRRSDQVGTNGLHVDARLTELAQRADGRGSAHRRFQERRLGLSARAGRPPVDTTLHRQYSWMLAAEGDTAASRREAERACREPADRRSRESQKLSK